MVVKRVDGEHVTPGHRPLKRLSRPSFTSYADLNRDGREDIVMSEFGYYAGHLSWFEKAADGSYSERLLNRFPGAISTYVYDFNGDGWPDIAALMGQAREGVFIYYNLGNGQFRESYEIQMPASYGSVHLSLVDFDGDGFVDALTANGDNADYPIIMKRYHGIRLHLNDGGNHFREAFFYPLNGAYKALAVDFDQDGDRDIAAISFFPDYDNSPEEAFVFLQNEGGQTFRAYSFPEAQEGRWLAMDAGDLDGDGDADIALGAFARGGSNVPAEMEARWRAQGPSVLILENRLH